MKDINKTLFTLFTKHKCDNYDMYNELLSIIESHTKDVIGEVDCEFYQVLCKLHNSENNAGWESRHSDRIQFLWDMMRVIEGRSEDYLP